ncbi:hypothetical protein CEXT_275591 [Caerostris extrusa]|uniref:Uncharacterized protein n=1 Tax=Caerostris extrusa TaxID=172846 RepID=A0AAV4PEH5_CAEEX|nr:hypothetical protein CEXT_275591 [Caerostris extrusa]
MQIALIHVSEKCLPVELLCTSSLSMAIKRKNDTFLSQVTLSLRDNTPSEVFSSTEHSRSDIHYHFPTWDLLEREKQRELLCFLNACFYISFAAPHILEAILCSKTRRHSQNYCFPDQ